MSIRARRGYNRTYVELKQVKVLHHKVTRYGYNRTYVELKLGFGCNKIFHSSVIIVLM